MSWINIALAFVFLCNLVFLVGATFLLYRIVDSTEQSRTELLKAAQQNSDAGNQLLTAAHRSIREMERASELQLARETSNHRAITELSFQVKSLVDNLKRVATKVSSAPATPQPPDELPTQRDELQALPSPGNGPRERMQQQLTEALARNQQLQDEIGQTIYKLKDVSHANQELMQEVRDLREVKKTTVDRLLQKAADLEAELEQARERAKAAEKLAENNAFKIEDLREQLGKQDFPAGEDQSGLVQSQQDQIDFLASREKALLARIEAVEQMFQRNLAEKEFIEERFLKLDSEATDVVEKPAPASPAAG